MVMVVVGRRLGGWRTRTVMMAVSGWWRCVLVVVAGPVPRRQWWGARATPLVIGSLVARRPRILRIYMVVWQ